MARLPLGFGALDGGGEEGLVNSLSQYAKHHNIL